MFPVVACCKRLTSGSRRACYWYTPGIVSVSLLFTAQTTVECTARYKAWDSPRRSETIDLDARAVHGLERRGARNSQRPSHVNWYWYSDDLSLYLAPRNITSHADTPIVFCLTVWLGTRGTQSLQSPVPLERLSTPLFHPPYASEFWEASGISAPRTLGIRGEYVMSAPHSF